MAGPLLLADLEGLSQPQLYSVCGGGIPPPSPTAATPNRPDRSSSVSLSSAVESIGHCQSLGSMLLLLLI